MSKFNMFTRNIIITTVITAMLLTSACTMAFATDEVTEEPAVSTETVMPEGCVTSVKVMNIDGEAIDSETLYYLNAEESVVCEDGTIVDSLIDSCGNLLDADGNVIETVIDAEGNMIDENGEAVTIVKAYLTDAEGNLANNNVYIATEDGTIIGAVFGFHMDEELNVVDEAGEVIIPAPSAEATEDETAGELEEMPEAVEEEEAEAASFEDFGEFEDIEDEDFAVVEDSDLEAAPVAKATAKGWKTVNGHKMYYYDSTNYYKNTRATIDGKEYAFDSKGYLYVNKFFTMDGKKYAALSSGELARGSFKMGNYSYFANLNTRVIRQKEGMFTAEGKRYYTKEDGKLVCSKSFTIDGKEYITAADGHVKTGAFKYNKKYHYADPETGVVNTEAGWIKNGSKKYLAKADGHLYFNAFKTVDDATYYFGEKAAMIKKGVFKAHDGKLYFAIPENNHIKVHADFVEYDGKMYYVTDGGAIKTSKKFKVDGKYYIAKKDGHLVKGIVKWGDSYYYLNSKRQIRTAEGLLSFKSGNKYYVGEGGKLVTSKFITIDGKKYRFGKKARALVGTFKLGNAKYTTDKSGAIVKKEYLDMKGIDVSYAQKSINWKKVAADGIDFAIIRVGYTGSSSGKCMEDDWFRDNIKQAKAAGLKVGVYYFTTAMTEAQGTREANFAANIIQSTGVKLDLPVVIDSEALPGSLAASKRGHNYNALSKSSRTTAVKAFCEQTVKNGYTPMIYASTSWLNSKLDMSKLSKYKVWVAQYNTKVTYGGTYQCWQYTSSGKVNGITGSVDMNIWYGYDK